MAFTLPNSALCVGSFTVSALFLRLLYGRMFPITAADQASLLQQGAEVHLALGGVTVAMLQFIDYPLGKLLAAAKDGDAPTFVQRLLHNGIQLKASFAWMMQEVPTLLAVAAHALFYRPSGVLRGILGGNAPTVADLPLLLFVAHYAHRSFVYPFAVIRTSNTMPLGVSTLANLYCCFNGRLQAGLFVLLAQNAQGGVNLPLALAGTAVFAAGMAVNVSHDRMLAGLRKSGKASGNGYVIPRGGFFETFAAPNLVGEIVEWLGYAAVCAAVGGRTGLWVGGAFAAYVVANLGPHCVSSHRWYQRRFGDEYTKLRRWALLPGVL